jgi:hypothetical protein
MEGIFGTVVFSLEAISSIRNKLKLMHIRHNPDVNIAFDYAFKAPVDSSAATLQCTVTDNLVTQAESA